MSKLKVDDKDHSSKELEQQKIILKEINKYLEKKIAGGKTGNVSRSETQEIKELEQQKILLSALVETLSKYETTTLDETLEILSHEFRTSLVPIRAYSDMILKGLFGELTEDQREKLQILGKNASSLDRLVSEAIDSKRIELGKAVINKTTNNITPLIIATLVKLDSKIRENDIVVSFSDKPFFSVFDEKRISQVLTHLIENAIKAIQRDKVGHLSGYGRIGIKVEEKADTLLVKVVDNGTGIPKEKMAKLFSKYGKVDSSSTRQDPGIGLGLYLCKQIIDAHGGRIWIESNQKNGTEVSFTLPKK